MPTYQYACTACGHRLEAVQTFTDEPLTECPACEGRLRKLFGAVGIVFKGSGFYRTDSRGAKGDSAKGEGAKGDVAKGDKKDAAPAAAKAESSSTGKASVSASASASSASAA